MLGTVLTTVLAAVTPQDSPPQGAGEKPIAGRVLDTAGQPVAGATVTLLSRPIPAWPDPEAEHRVTLTTDARGMFHGKLRAQQDYSAWARWPKRSSAIVEGVHGGFVELRAAPGRWAQEVRVSGIDRWREQGVAEIRCRTISGTENIDFVDVPLVEGMARIPALPDAPPTLEFLDGKGRLLWAAVPRQPGNSGDWLAHLPPLREVSVRTQDGDGKPIAGATIRYHIRNYWYTASPAIRYGDRFRPLWPACGTTDQKGELTNRIPIPDATTFELWLLAEKPGKRTTLFGWQDARPIYEGVIQEPTSAPANPLALAAVATLRSSRDSVTGLAVGGKLVDGHASFLVRPSVSDPKRGHRRTLLMLPPMPVDEGCALGFDLPKKWLAEGAWVTLRATDAADLSAMLKTRIPVAVHLRCSKSASSRQFVDPLRPDSNRVLEIIDPDGRAASGAIAVVSPHLSRRFWSGTTTLRADQRGRILIPTDNGEQVVVVATATGYGRVVLDGNDARRRLLALRERPVVTGTVVSREGIPLAGARIARARSANDPAETEIEDLDPHLVPREMANSLLRLMPPVVTAADGTFRYRLLPYAGTLELRVDRYWGRSRLSDWERLPADGSNRPRLRFEIDAGGR